MMKRFWKLLALLLAATLVLAACGNDDDDSADVGTDDAADDDTAADDTADDGDVADDAGSDDEALVVYSGRSEELVGPLLEMFEEETGIEVEVRYGDTAEMAGLIQTEGDNSPADVYYGQDAGALGALSAEGRLVELPAELVEQVPAALRSEQGEWVGLSGRARVAAYNTEALSEDEVPDSILDLTDPEWSGRVGWAPTNGSFQAFVTALRVLEGEDGARAWLEGMVANQPEAYEGNSAVLEAVGSGEVEVGLVNHYYLYQYLVEDPEFPVANKLFEGGDPGALVNVAGAGIVDTSDRQDDALELLEWLLSDTAQQYFAEETFEIPVIDGIEQAAEVPDLEALTLPEIDLDRLEDLEGTLELLNEVGAL